MHPLHTQDDHQSRRGIVIHAQDCGELWASRLERDTCGLNVLGIHPEGGPAAHESLEQALALQQTAEFADFCRRMHRLGIAVEWEMHALSWLVERSLFDTCPHWFREENGVRTTASLDLTSQDIYDSPYFYLQQNDVIYVKPNKYRAQAGEISQNRSFYISLISTAVSVATLIVTLTR